MGNIRLFKKVISAPIPRVTLDCLPKFIPKGQKPEGCLFLNPLNGEKVYITNDPTPFKYVRSSTYYQASSQTAHPAITKISFLQGRPLSFFLNEVNHMFRFKDHPGIVSYHRVFQFQNISGKFGCIVMPKCKPYNSSVSAWKFLHDLKVIVSTLVDIHQRNLAHNDIKIDNLLIANQGSVVLCDLESMTPCYESNQKRTFYDIASCLGDSSSDSMAHADKRPTDIWGIGMLILDFFQFKTYLHRPVLDKGFSTPNTKFSYEIPSTLREELMTMFLNNTICYRPYKNSEEILTNLQYNKQKASQIIHTCLNEAYDSASIETLTREILDVLDKHNNAIYHFNNQNPIHLWHRDSLPRFKQQLLTPQLDTDIYINEARRKLAPIMTSCLQKKPKDRPTAPELYDRINQSISHINKRFNDHSDDSVSSDDLAENLPAIPTSAAQNRGCCTIS